ncbi:MAG TPA: hypothetical protein VHC19_16945, partial [Pirellulales bacterium]|nr:hypothetical protein [Pirellulales bacterium]
MSTLSEAFIKAYQRQQIIPAPHIALTPAPGSTQTQTAPQRAAQPAAREQPTAHGIPAARQPREISLGPSERAPQANDLAAKDVPSPARQSLPSTAPKPATTTAAEALQAALEVEQFDWPEPADALRAAAVEQWTTWQRQFAAGAKTWMVTSQYRGEGRTTVLLAAARHLALAGQGVRVVLVDADFERPQLAQQLGVAVQIGWEDVFADRQPLAEALVESTSDRVTLLALREPVAARDVLAGGVRLTASLRSLRQHFDFVCIDAGPLADAADMVQSTVFGLETGIDAALMVRDLRRADGEESAVLGRRLAQ